MYIIQFYLCSVQKEMQLLLSFMIEPLKWNFFSWSSLWVASELRCIILEKWLDMHLKWYLPFIALPAFYPVSKIQCKLFQCLLKYIVSVWLVAFPSSDARSCQCFTFSFPVIFSRIQFYRMSFSESANKVCMTYKP